MKNNVYYLYFEIKSSQSSYSAMYPKKEIIICLGSSCFARGNKELMKFIEKYLRQKKVTDKVTFRGDHCFEKCTEGPNLMIDGKIYHGVNKDNVIDFLMDGLKDIFK